MIEFSDSVAAKSSSSMQWLAFSSFSRSAYCYDCEEVQPILQNYSGYYIFYPANKI